MRRVASCASAIRAVVVTALATHSRPACSAEPDRAEAARSQPGHGRRPPPASAGAISQSRSMSCSASQSVSDVLQLRQRDAGRRGRRVDGAAQLVERDELRGRDPLAREPLQRREHVVARLLERPHRADRGGGGVVDLVGEAGGERAERDQRLALAGVDLDAPGRADQAAQQVDREGEPRLADPGELGCRQPEDPGRLHDPRRPHVDAVVVPRAEAAGPLARRAPWSP